MASSYSSRKWTKTLSNDMVNRYYFGAHEITQLSGAWLGRHRERDRQTGSASISPFPEACVCRTCENSLTGGEAEELLTDDLQVDSEDLCVKLSGFQGHICRSWERQAPALSWMEYNGKTRRQAPTCRRARGVCALGRTESNGFFL